MARPAGGAISPLLTVTDADHGCLLPRSASPQPRLRRIYLATQYVQADEVLILTVKEARNVSGSAADSDGPRTRAPNPFLNVFVDPDPASRLMFKSRTVTRTDNPVFAEAFSLKLGAEDADKRLHVGVWDWQQDQPDTFLGCLSFAVRELIPPAARQVSGWFLLLSREEGAVRNTPAAAPQHFLFADRSRSGSTGSMGSVVSIQSMLDPYGDDECSSPFMDAEITPTEEARQVAVRELINVERLYLSALNQLNEIFVEPLTIDLTSSQHENIFANIDALIELSTSFLEQLSARQVSASLIGQVGDIVRDHLAKMRGPYTVYCANKQRAILEINTLIEGDSDFKQFLRAQAARNSEANINRLLLAPIQHLRGLPARIFKVSRHTPPSHEDYYNAQEAATKAKKLVDQITVEVQKLGSLAKMSFYEDRMVYPEKMAIGNFKLSTPGRDFVRKGQLVWVNPKPKTHFPADQTGKRSKGTAAREVGVLVFTDVMLLIEETDGSVAGEHNYHAIARPIYFPECSVAVVNKSKTEFIVSHKKLQYQLAAQTDKERKMWCRLITEPRKVHHGTLLFSTRTTTTLHSPAAPRSVHLAIEGENLGFALRPDAPGYVLSVESGSSADGSGLSSLDQVLRINGTEVASLTHEGVMELLVQQLPGKLHLVVIASLRKATVIQEPNGGLGFMLRGERPVFFRSIKPGGAAEKGGLRLGDQLWEVDGHNVRHLPHAEVVRLIKQAGHSVQLVVRSALWQTTIPRGPSGFGFKVKQQRRSNVTYVSSVFPDGTARKAGLRLGDQIWQVNGIKVRDEGAEVVEHLIRSSMDEVVMVVISTLRDLTVTIPPQGAFGFTLQGSAPVRIGRVDPGSPAAKAGLKPKDAIWAVNGVEAVGMGHHEVVDLVRMLPSRVTLSVALS